jgi:NADP-dependent 3-hydroxy acid dehydrogenase YdfG
MTGGSCGIGLATAKRFVEEGAYVFITGRRESELPAAIQKIGRNVTGAQGDVSQPFHRATEELRIARLDGRSVRPYDQKTQTS